MSNPALNPNADPAKLARLFSDLDAALREACAEMPDSSPAMSKVIRAQHLIYFEIFKPLEGDCDD